MRCRKGEGLWSKVGQLRDRADVETQGERLTWCLSKELFFSNGNQVTNEHIHFFFPDNYKQLKLCTCRRWKNHIHGQLW